MKNLSMFWFLVILLVTGCSSPIKPAEPSAMVPKKLKPIIPADTSIYVERTTLGSAAAEGKAPFDASTGKFPLVQQQGLENFQKSVRLALVAAGAQSPTYVGMETYVLRPAILGGMTIPFPEAYSILFVHYQLEDSKTGKVVWSKNFYSQAKLQNVGAAKTSGDTQDPAYALLAAANLRQMITDLSEWLSVGK